jgi:xylan 1,4-beta-xylosidase
MAPLSLRHLFATLLIALLSIGSTAAASFPVLIQVDASKNHGNLEPIWRFFGADEPNYATMPNGKKLLSELGDLGRDQVYFRTHNLLNSGDGTPGLKWGSTGVYAEDSHGNPTYNWSILDQIFEAYRSSGVRPYVEIGFMPEALSIKPEPYRHHWTPQARYNEIFTGWAYPPKNYRAWADLVFQWTKHSVEKFGRAEVESWFWEVWNEPNIGYWQGTPEQFLELHDYAIDAVRRALPTAKVGGPDSAGSGGKFTRAFLEHCLHGTNYATGQIGTPLDFVSFHAKGAPIATNSHVRMGIGQHLRTVAEGFEMVSSFPELKKTPIIIGESDPEGCAACQGPALAYRNGLMYSSYTAASFAREYDLGAKYGVKLEGVLTWAFEFENQPYFAGFRSLASNGIDKPVLNVFRMFSRMSGRRLAVASDHAIPLDSILKSGVRDQPDVSALATLNDRKLRVLLWHYHDDDLPGPDAEIELTLEHVPFAPGEAHVQQFRIDVDHSNAYARWTRMGSPQSPTAEQYEELERAGRLTSIGTPSVLPVNAGKAILRISLPRQGVALLEVN